VLPQKKFPEMRRLDLSILNAVSAPRKLPQANRADETIPSGLFVVQAFLQDDQSTSLDTTSE
jgi:hypothetical protein